MVVKFFATLKDRVGHSQIEVELPANATVRDLKTILARLFPHAHEALAASLSAVDQEFAFDDDELPTDGEVAFFPPVSGGESLPTIVRVTDEAIDLDELLEQITLPSSGAAAVFTGMVRGITRRGDPHETICLYYEAYVPMAEVKMRQVANEIRAKWPVIEGIALVQRTGQLLPRTPTVLIACTAAHRDTGVFDAARYGIDRLKEIVPVWKKEIGPNGEEWVEGDYIPRPGD